MFQSCAHHTCAHHVTCASLWLLCSQSLREAHSVSRMHPSAHVSICVTPPASSSPGASSSSSGTATNSGSSGTETGASQLGFEEDLWGALRLGTLPDASPSEFERFSPARQQQRVDETGAGRQAGRSLQAELAMAAEAEPDAPPSRCGADDALGTRWRRCGC